MKRKFMKIAIVVAIVAVSGINVFNSQKPEALSDVAMANVEALANGEDSDADCLGSGEYSFVGLVKGTLQEYFHKPNGMDKMITYDVERCVAEGSGTLRGTIGIFSKFPKSEEEVPCTRNCENNIIW